MFNKFLFNSFLTLSFITSLPSEGFALLTDQDSSGAVRVTKRFLSGESKTYVRDRYTGQATLIEKEELEEQRTSNSSSPTSERQEMFFTHVVAPLAVRPPHPVLRAQSSSEDESDDSCGALFGSSEGSDLDSDDDMNREFASLGFSYGNEDTESETECPNAYLPELSNPSLPDSPQLSTEHFSEEEEGESSSDENQLFPPSFLR